MKKLLSEEEFFFHLLNKTKETFTNAPVRIVQERLGQKWNYSVCETAIKKNTGVFFGLNWGGGSKEDYNPQSVYPDLEKNKRNWPFINAARKYLHEYFEMKDDNSFNYSNACFFRSPNIDFLVKEDWTLSIPLFKQYIEYINPPWTLKFGNSDLIYLKDYIKIEETITIDKTNRKMIGYKGVLFSKYPFYCLPHPNNWRYYSKDFIEELWQQMFNKNQL